MKVERTAIALNPAKRIAVVLGEQALHTRRGTPAEHSDQLHHLLSLMRLPFVSVGIIPADTQRYAIASIGFWIFDNNAVASETPTAAAIKVTRPLEIALYPKLFDQLQSQAVYGPDGRRLVQRAVPSESEQRTGKLRPPAPALLIYSSMSSRTTPCLVDIPCQLRWRRGTSGGGWRSSRWWATGGAVGAE